MNGWEHQRRTVAVHNPKINAASIPTISFLNSYSAAARLRVPILMVGGSADPVTRSFQETALRRTPGYALNRFVTVSADHRQVPIAAEDAMLQWLKDIAVQP